MRIFLTLVIFLLVLATGTALLIWSGVYNIAATQPHADVTRRLFAVIRDRSIEEHSDDITPPPLSDAELVQTGLRSYHSTCALCHRAPGVEHTQISQGLNPKPPRLDTEKVQSYSDAELYWIVKHGIKMTGMPGFVLTHNDQQLWAMVAFLRHLPGLTPEEYQAMVNAAGLAEGAGAQGHHREENSHQSPTPKAGQGGHH